LEEVDKSIEDIEELKQIKQQLRHKARQSSADFSGFLLLLMDIDQIDVSSILG